MLLAFASAAPSAGAQEGGVGVFNGPTLPQDIGRVSLSYRYDQRGHVYRRSSQTRDPHDTLLNKHIAVAGFDYGVLPDLTLSVLVPVEYNRLSTSPLSGSTVLRSYGLGDAAILGKYRVLKIDWTQSAFNLSVVGGLEFPTGESREREGGALLPGSIQVGSGSWNPFLAVSSTISIGRVRVDGRVFGKLNTKGRGDVDRGDELSANLAVKYRYWHEKYPGPTGSVVLGVSWNYQGRATEDGHQVSNSGHTIVFLSPAIGFHPIPRMDLGLTVDVPIYQRYHGTQLGRDFRVTVAGGFRF